MGFWGKKEDDNEKNKQPEGSGFQAAPPSPTPIQSAPKVNSPVESNVSSDPYGKVRSALGPGTIIQGRLSFDTVVSIDGKLGGEIFSSKALLVGPSGVIDAQIDAQVLIVKGIVRGTIRATERVEIRGAGQIIGDVNTPILVMDPGCILQGSCTMPQVKTESSSKPIDVKKELKEKSDVPPSQITPEVEQISAIV